MSYPLISIIVPIYNSEDQLGRCVDSLINQTYRNLEIILIDDGSKDSSWAICQEYEKKDSRVKSFHKQNGGVSSARNLGMELACGEYIGFLDSDDYVAPELYSDMVDILNTNGNLDGIRYQLRSVSGDKLGESTSSKHPGLISLEDKQYALKLILVDHEFPSVACFMFRKASIKRSFNEKVNIAEDYLFLMHFIMGAEKVFITNNTYYYYIYNETSIMHSYTDLGKSLSYLKSQLTVCRVARKYIEKYGSEELKSYQEQDVKEVISTNISRLFPDISYGDYKQYIHDVRSLKEFRFFNREHLFDSYLNTHYPAYFLQKTSKKGKAFLRKIIC